MASTSTQKHAAVREAAAAARRGPWRALLRWGATLALLAVAAYHVDLGLVGDRLSRLSVGWTVGALMLSVPLHLLLAARWWFVAGRLGAPLAYRRAVGDYYLGNFLNQTVPVGLTGAAVRAVRHAARLEATGARRPLALAIRVLLLERVAGFAASVVLALVAAASLAGDNPRVAAVAAACALGAVLASGLVVLIAQRRRGALSIAAILDEAREALLARGAFGVQAVVSTAAIALLVAMFYCAARAAGVDLEVARAVRVAPLILGAMTLPISFAGWGIREATAAALFGALGLDAGAGVLIAVTFGLLSLVATAPGAVAWLMRTPATDGDAAQAVAPARRAPSWALPVWLGMFAIVAAIALNPAVFSVAGAAAFAAWYARDGRDRRALVPNAITLARVALVAGLGFAYPLLGPVATVAVLLACFALDGLDGRVARRLDAATPFGAELDKEADAYLVMMMCLLLAVQGIAPAWVLIAGLWRYIYAAVIHVAPGLGSAPRSQLARYVHGTLVGTLVACFALPAYAVPLAATGTVAVSASFLRSFAVSARLGREMRSGAGAAAIPGDGSGRVAGGRQ